MASSKRNVNKIKTIQMGIKINTQSGYVYLLEG